MKKLFSSSAILLAATLFVSVSLTAQKSSEPSFRNANVNVSPDNPNPSSNVTAINSKALKSFSRNYKTAADVSWSNSGELIQASFKEDGKQNRVFYRQNGKWFRTIITYDQSLLRKDIKALVNRNFRKYQISCVTEVHEGAMDAYFINIDSPRDFKQVIVYEGEIFVHQEYNKQ